MFLHLTVRVLVFNPKCISIFTCIFTGLRGRRNSSLISGSSIDCMTMRIGSFTAALDKWDDFYRSRCFLCHKGDPFILTFLPSNPSGCGKLGQHTSSLYQTIILIVGAENCFIKRPFVWWKPIRFA